MTADEIKLELERIRGDIKNLEIGFLELHAKALYVELSYLITTEQPKKLPTVL